MVCESYFAAIRTASPAQIEAIDMGRRGLHNEGAQLLAERLHGKIDCDFDTARRIFTLDHRAALEGLSGHVGRPASSRFARSILFACTLNAVRSPMAEALTR